MAKNNNLVTGSQIVAQAHRYLGVPYAWGGTSSSGMDCSGLVYRCAHNLGLVGVPRTSEEQFAYTQRVTDPGPGDLAFFAGSDGTVNSPGHVGIVVSSGRMIDAPYTGTTVRYDTYSQNQHSGFGAFSGYGRIPRTKTSASANTATDSGVQNTTDEAAGAVGAFFGTVLFVVIVILALGAIGLLLAAGIVFAG